MRPLVLMICTLVALAGLSINACKKDETNHTAPPSPDHEPPEIFIASGNPRTHLQGAQWSYPGATAVDSIDGDVSSTIVRTGFVDPNVVGTYFVYYSAHDTHFNSNTDTLQVNVLPVTLFSQFAPGTYNAHDSCSIMSPFNYTVDVYMVGSSEDSIRINNFGGFGYLVNVIAIADTSNSTLSFPVPQSLTGAASLTGATGVYSHVGLHTEITIWYTWTDGSGTDSCVSQYVKQP